MQSKTFSFVIVMMILNLLLVAVTGASAAQASQTVTGILGSDVIDAHAFDGESQTRYFIADGSGSRLQVNITPEVLGAAGGHFAVYGRMVTLSLDTVTRDGAATVNAINVMSDTRWFDVDPVGAQHWHNLLCKFNGNSSAPATREFISAMMDDAVNGMGVYWSSVSHGAISFTHTTTAWKTMPANITPSSNFYDILDACVSLHDLNPNGSYQVNTFYNVNIGSAMGGYYFPSPSVTQRYTWMPDWAYNWGYPTLVHEMGHAYGMPHGNNNDGDTNPYDNPWDVMSGPAPMTNYHDGATHDYFIGKPMNNYYAHQLGFIQSADVFTYSGSGYQEVIIDHVGLGSTDNYFSAYIPLTGGKLFSLEARSQPKGGFEAGFRDLSSNQPLSGILVYNVNPTRSEPAWQVLATTDANGGTGASILTVGESFSDPASQLTITVLEQTAEGFRVSISQSLPFTQISPAKDNTVTGVFPTLEWRPFEGATQYTVSVVSKTEGLTFNYSATVDAASACAETCTFIPSGAAWKVKSGAKYQWFVKAQNPNKTVLKTTPKWAIYFQALPTSITINGPDSGGTVSGMTAFSWLTDTRVATWTLVLRNKAGVVKFQQTYTTGDICNDSLCIVPLDLTSFKKGTYTWKVTAKHPNALGKKNSPWRTLKIQAVSSDTSEFRAP